MLPEERWDANQIIFVLFQTISKTAALYPLSIQFIECLIYFLKKIHAGFILLIF